MVLRWQDVGERSHAVDADHTGERAARLRELGKHLQTMSIECLVHPDETPAPVA